MKTTCKCGHDVDMHALYCCHAYKCGCGGADVVSQYTLESDRIRKTMARFAEAERSQQLQPVVISEERRTA